ncbi:hypothetical protein SODALDRAFT_358312 [Sodiomyces alkalinus F11]|uniref:Uncharacterized protein n=1 Tax=Sodiomyces alkalinus (strain CBS 110278 / VKM F-3762 / F11) TaxID=1314773 RepID=A0A3N2PZG8_SODAK|nr:hypothetical protein SODALDRAFT_358312 [Sodiomyces alkalinus F11]ROT39897.1 hypothetical protein SODALDRAFT_358312 [Sodiomyces alkalinus F11]
MDAQEECPCKGNAPSYQVCAALLCFSLPISPDNSNTTLQNSRPASNRGVNSLLNKTCQNQTTIPWIPHQSRTARFGLTSMQGDARVENKLGSTLVQPMQGTNQGPPRPQTELLMHDDVYLALPQDPIQHGPATCKGCTENKGGRPFDVWKIREGNDDCSRRGQ